MRTRLAILFGLLLTAGLMNTAFAQDKNAEGAVGKVKLSGLVFGDLYYNADMIDAAKNDVNGWQFRRIYITTDYTISENFASRFRIEAPLSGSGKITSFVKDAWLKWKEVYQGADLVVGMSPTPAFDVSEGAWHYRSLEKTTMDYFGIVSSRDLGIDLKGKFDSKGMVKYWLKVGDGTGNAPESDKYKRYYGQLQFTPNDNLLITLYGDMASKSPVKDPKDTTNTLSNDATVLAGFVNYHSGKAFSIGVEAFMRSQQNAYSDPTTSELGSMNALGVSVWAWGAIMDNLNLVLRYDMYDPNTNANAKNDDEGLLVGALDFKVDHNVSVMPGVEMHTKKKVSMDANGNETTETVKDLVPRITFFWKF